MAGQTITEKILAKASGKEYVEPGQVIWAKADGLMMHDVTSDLAIDVHRESFGGELAKGLEVIVVPDHYVPAKDIKSAALYGKLKGWAAEQKARGANITTYMLEDDGDYGVCHVMLPYKGHITPGSVWFGGDSHTCTYGAFGAFSTGNGSTESGNVLGTGDLWLRVPETYKFEVNGKMPNNVMAKDLFLRVVGDVGVDGCLYQAMEWRGDTIRNMSMDERMTLTNMAIEAGAKSGIIEPDEETAMFLIRNGAIEPDRGLSEYPKLFRSQGLFSDQDAQYANTKKIDGSSLVPLVAKPHLPSNVQPASELENIKIDQAYIGSCTGGKWGDFVAAAKVLKGHKKAPNVRLMIVPTTKDIQRRMVNEGLYDTFMDAGGIFSAPTCGACLGGYMGILDKGEKCISTTNRNFIGRMGHPKSEVYLASPQTVAASAIAGYITGARK